MSKSESSSSSDLEAEREHADSMPFLKGSDYWFVWDPCGIVCAVLTYMLIMYGEFVVLVILAPPFPNLFTLVSVCIFTAFATLAVISHLKTMLTEPVSGGRGVGGVTPASGSTPPCWLGKRLGGEVWVGAGLAVGGADRECGVLHTITSLGGSAALWGWSCCCRYQIRLHGCSAPSSCVSKLRIECKSAGKEKTCEYIIPCVLDQHVPMHTNTPTHTMHVHTYTHTHIHRGLSHMRVHRRRKSWRGGRKERTSATARNVEASNPREPTTAGEHPSDLSDQLYGYMVYTVT